MKKLIIIILTVIGVCGCTDKDEKHILNVYNWADYLSDDVITAFQEEYDCEIVVTSFDDNESMLAKLMSGGGGYDIVLPSSYVIPIMAKNDLIVALDTNRLPTVIRNLDSKYEKLFHADTLKYSVPYAFSMTGIAYRKDKLKTADCDQSWSMIKLPDFSGRVCMLQDMREIIGIGLKLNGKSLNSTNSTDIMAAADTMLEYKKYAKKLDNLDFKNGLVTGNYYIAMGYNSDMAQLIEENPDVSVEFFIPKEGSTACFDEFVITKDCKNVDLAYAFIDYMYRPDVALKNMEYICTAMPNNAVFEIMSDEMKANEIINPTETTLNRLEVILDVGETQESYNKAWDVFMGGRNR